MADADPTLVGRLDPARLAAALADHPLQQIPALPGRRNHRKAGVLVPLAWDPTPTVLLTERPSRLRRHGGELSFPGGKPEPVDGGELVRTALREAHEELGIEGARVLGRLSSMPLFTSDFRLVPHVAAVPAGPLRPCPVEVEQVVPVRLEAVFAQPVLDCLAFPWNGSLHHSLVLSLDGDGGVVEPGQGVVLFGATAETFTELLQVVAAAVPGLRLPPWRTGRWRWDMERGRPALDDGG